MVFVNIYFGISFQKKHIPDGYISSTSVAIIEEVSFCGDKLYYSGRTHKWFIDAPNKKFREYQELPYDMMVYYIPFQNIIGHRFGLSDWTDKNEPIFFTRYKYNSRKLFSNDIMAVTRAQYGRFPSNKLTLNKTKQIKRYRTYLYKIKARYNHIIKIMNRK